MSMTFPNYLFFIQMFLNNDNMKEELLKTMSLQWEG
jgi:hypothetical protein